MSERTPLDDTLAQWQRKSVIVASVGIALCCLAAVINLDQFLQSYLLGFVFWWSITVGSLGLLMLGYLVGGYWSAAARPLFEAGCSLAPLTALLFLPLALGLDILYPWTEPETISSQKAIYLNVPFFLTRAVVYFIVWSLLSWFLRGDPDVSVEDQPRWRRLMSSGGLVLLFLTVTFAAIDWGMSLDPLWFSSIYGAIVAIGGGLGALCLATFVLAILQTRFQNRQESGRTLIVPDTLADLGTLTMAFLMLWTYFSFSQFLIIWSGNLPEENFWYIQRMRGGWQYVGLWLSAFQFFIPFFMLLSRDVKHNPRVLGGLTLWLLVMLLFGFLWILSPSFHPENFFIHWSDLVTPIALGGVWVSGFLWMLRRRIPQSLSRSIS